MDLVAKGVITSAFIDISSILVDLNDLFTRYWRTIEAPGRVSSIAFPFSRMHNEPFWKLIPRPGQVLSPAVIRSIDSVSRLQAVALGGEIDEELLVLMSNPESRYCLRMKLLDACFSEEGRVKISAQISINEAAFDYGIELLRRAHQHVSVSGTPGQGPREARSQGFRRVVIRSYDHRCALCGVRIITPEGHTVVDAAHIIPWSESQNDDIRNGMALCKLCHWAFDEGMMGVSREYRVIASRRIGESPNAPGFLVTLDNREIVAPSDKDLWPGTDYLSAHRARFML
jgi:putative restriction endonuclease